MIVLALRQGQKQVERFQFFQARVAIGRAPENDIVLKPELVSLEHALIEQQGGAFVLTDSSRFGTKVNRREVGDQQIALQKGDLISIPPFTIEVMELAADAERQGRSFRAQRRWDTPFDTGMTEADVDRVLSMKPFNLVATDQQSRLRDILRYDARMRTFKGTEIMLREGDYGDTVSLILSGAVRVFKGLPPAALGQHVQKKKGPLASLAQLLVAPLMAEVRDLEDYHVPAAVTGERRAVLDISAAELGRYDAMRLEAGHFIGEISALSRAARTATVVPDGEVEILEIRWQGFRDIRMYNAAIREETDQRYRDNSLLVHLQEAPMFSHLANPDLAKVAQSTTVERFGRFDWFAEFGTLSGRGGHERVEAEPLIVREGDYPNGIIMVRSGFARVSRKANSGHYTARYMGPDDQYIFGLEELLAGWQQDHREPFRYSLRAIGYADILRIPTAIVERYLSEAQIIDYLAATVGKADAEGDGHQPAHDQAMQEFLVENRLINGTQAMVIDLDRCTRCDDCVRACATTHDGNPRFIRHGKQFGKYMIANACMHCADPVCMIGCPTGAITRNVSGQVFINDKTCIGCSTCANSCPYDNIRMVEIRDSTSGDAVFAEERGAAILKATKCDLCADQIRGPACERACPHDALKRMNLCDPQNLTDAAVE